MLGRLGVAVLWAWRVRSSEAEFYPNPVKVGDPISLQPVSIDHSCSYKRKRDDPLIPDLHCKEDIDHQLRFPIESVCLLLVTCSGSLATDGSYVAGWP